MGQQRPRQIVQQAQDALDFCWIIGSEVGSEGICDGAVANLGEARRRLRSSMDECPSPVGGVGMIVGALGIQPSNADREPDLTPFPMDAQRRANFDYFIRHDFTAAVLDDVDSMSVSASSTRIIPAAGIATPATVYDFQCAQALAGLTGERLRVFPGGHNGNLTHPRAYADALLDAFCERS